MVNIYMKSQLIWKKGEERPTSQLITRLVCHLVYQPHYYCNDITKYKYNINSLKEQYTTKPDTNLIIITLGFIHRFEFFSRLGIYQSLCFWTPW